MENNKEKDHKLEKTLKIGEKCILVHRTYAFQNKKGGRLIPARLSTYANINGKVEPVFTIIGAPKSEVTMGTYIPFIDVQKAIDSIITK
jgi:hypothetical protein